MREKKTPPEVSAFLADLNRVGHNRKRVAEVSDRHTRKLHPRGWRFYDLSDGWEGEWNVSCTPPPPNNNRHYCLQTFSRVPHRRREPKWKCYVVENKKGINK